MNPKQELLSYSFDASMLLFIMATLSIVVIDIRKEHMTRCDSLKLLEHPTPHLPRGLPDDASLPQKYQSCLV